MVTQKAKDIEVDAKLKYTLKGGITETLDADWYGNATISGFGFFLDAQGTLDVAVRANATPVLKGIPYAGPVLLGLDKSGLMTIKGVFETTLGSKFKVELNTHFPKPGTGGTQTRGAEPPHSNLLGGTELKKEIKIIIRLAAGLQISALRGSIEGTALFQVGAPSDAPSVEGILITVNPVGEGPLFTKIEGAFSAVVRAGVNLWTVKFQKQWQWDFARWVIDRKSEPSFELVPVNITYTVINATSAPQQKFIGKGGVILDQFYGAGSLNVTDSAQPLLVFTGIDPATGKMTVMVSLQTGDQWSTPVQIGSAAGVISVAVVKNPGGGWLAVWSQISDADVGSPYPSSTLKYALSDNEGKNWSPSELLVSAPEAMFDLKLASAGNQVVLAYLSTSEGPLGNNQSLRSATWDGARWSAPSQRLGPQSIKNYDLAGNSDTNVLAVVSTGADELVSSFWDGRNWSSAEKFAEGAGTTVSLKFNSTKEAALAWADGSDGIAFSTFDVPTRLWTHRGVPISSAVTDECEILPLNVNGEPLYLLAWTQGGDTTSLWHAFLDEHGAIRMDPTEVTLDTAGTFRSLQVRPLASGQAVIAARYSTLTSNSIREFPVGLPTATDCDGDGVADAAEIASGSARDCNGNTVPDNCDIRRGTSQDRNRNGIPDECEAAAPDDCNRNGIADEFELAVGLSDANGNGVLDDCESLAVVKKVALPQGVQTYFYRALKIGIRSVTVDSLELQYEGTLEQAERVTGPWSPVP